MKNIFSKIFKIDFKESLKGAFFRFPIAFVSSIFIFIILEFLVYKDNEITEHLINLLLKGVLSLVVVYFLSFGIYLFSERFNLDKIKTYFAQLFSIIFGIFFYFSFNQNLFRSGIVEEILYIIITLIGIICFIYFSYFIKNIIDKKLDNNKYYTFFNIISSKILMAIIVGFALTLLGFLALFTVFSLFELSDIINEGKTYGYWTIFSLSLFAPIYFLTIAPEKKLDISILSKIIDNKFYNFLSNYIALPFIIIYFFILYAYSIKVLLDFSSWPEGMISWMVILFSLFGYLIFTFSYAFEIKSNLVKIFRKTLPFAVLFQTPMLFYAIYLRINQYDLTINRYLVVVFGIFLVFISLYFIFSKKKYLLNISLLLTIFIILISIGPWGVYKLPEIKQKKLLVQDLKKANILQGDQIILLKDENDIDAKLSGKIYEKVKYLCDYHSCDSMYNIFGGIIDDIKEEDKKEWKKNHEERIKTYQENIDKYTGNDEEKVKDNKESLELEKKEKYLGISSWEYKNKLVEKLKVKQYYDRDGSETKYINFYSNKSNSDSLVNIKGYDYLLNIGGIRGDGHYIDDKIITDILYTANFDTDNENIIIFKNGENLEDFNLGDEFNSIYEEYKKSVNEFGTVYLDKDIEVEKIGQNIDIKIILTNFSIKNKDYKGGEDNRYSYPYVNGKVLIREK